MILRRIRRKLYKITHPAIAEVWMLHRVVDSRSDLPGERTLEVTPTWLRQQVDQHLAAGGRFVSLDTLMHELQQPAKRQKGTVAVTFDEGCRETLEQVLPLFRQRQIPFALFVATDFVGGAHPIGWYRQQPPMMSWDELAAVCRDPLCTIGAHTVSHPHLCQLSEAQVMEELTLSRQQLEERLHIPIRNFSYPYGERNAAVMECARQAGYTAAFEAWGGAVRTRANRYNLPRIPKTQTP